MKRLSTGLILLLAGCAPLPPQKPAEPAFSAQKARNAVIIGKSTKADVRAALGEAITVDFDSGHEVWVYRERLKEKQRPPAPELVLLFAPSGILAKMR
jgi:hypothetical protein